MNRPYFEETGIGVYHETDELVTDLSGSKPWTPTNHPTNPDYSSVSPDLFKYLESDTIAVIRKRLEPGHKGPWG